jgi:hypothetical protein
MTRSTAALIAPLLVLSTLAPAAALPDPVAPKSEAKPAKSEPATALPAPVPLGATASPAAALAQPAPAPLVVPKASGKMEVAAGQQKARIEDKVSKAHPTAYSYSAPAGSFWVGVSSPKSDVFLTVFDHATKQPIPGTLPSDGAVRLLLNFSKPTELLFVAYTESEGTPFRFEITLGGMNL